MGGQGHYIIVVRYVTCSTNNPAHKTIILTCLYLYSKKVLDKWFRMCYVIYMMNIVDLEKRIDNGEKFSKRFIAKVIKSCAPVWDRLTCPEALDRRGKDLLGVLEDANGLPRAIQRTIIKLKQARK